MKDTASYVYSLYSDKAMKNGVIKIMILGYIKAHKTYPYKLLGVIKSAKLVHGYKITITKNDIYNLTSALEKAGYIKGKTTLKGNKAQKVFTITKRGESVVENKNKIFMAMIDDLRKLAKAEFND